MDINYYKDFDEQLQYLIFVFSENRYKNLDSELLKFKISQLNFYQYSILLSKVILLISIEDLVKYFFLLTKNKVQDIIFESKKDIDNNVITECKANCKPICFKDLDSTDLYDIVFSKLRQINFLEREVSEVISELLIKLKFMREIHTNKVACSFDLVLVDNELSEIDSNISLTIEDFSFPQILENSILLEGINKNFEVSNQYEILKDIISKLNLVINEKKELDYKDFTVFPLVFTLKDWKELVYKNLIKETCKEVFERKKDYLKNCIDFYLDFSNTEYINHGYYYENNQRLPSAIERCYSDSELMKKWIDDTFLSPNKIKQDNSKDFICEIPIKDKLKISERYNQSIILKTLQRYFETHQIKYEIQSIESLIYHFTTIELPQNKRGYNAKFIKYSSLKMIDFIPKQNCGDIIKIFLNFKEYGVISNKVNDTFRIIELMFSKNIEGGFKGMSKYYWNKGAKSDKALKIENEDFWFYFRSWLPKKKNFQRQKR